MAEKLKTLRLILGDQLNHKHSWYNGDQDHITYLIMEMRQETDYVTHHIQKVIGFFSAMRNFADYLSERDHTVIYYRINDKENQQDLKKNIKELISDKGFEKFEYQLPDEYRLDEQLKELTKELEIETQNYDTEHFLTGRDELTKIYEGKKQLTMEYFYRHLRKKFKVLMETDSNPEGGKWNFDKSNRKKWKGEPEIPHERGFRKDVSDLNRELEKAGISTIGTVEEKNFNWPTSREDSLSVLNYFCKNLLVHFGDYQDALHTDEEYLFHSRLSFSMNTKMLSPKEVIDSVIDHYYENKDEIDISQVEGFVRQILGWREYMRGIYWKEMPGYRKSNKLRNQNELPPFYWDAKTKMNCLHHSIKNSLENAYAHHIQRLMITGNFALLTETHPDEVDRWYLGIYIDAIEWVEITNTRGMSQFADGGIVATKPYVSSGSYINKMSNYCKGCHYKVSKKTEEDACPFNSLYWNFLDSNQERFRDNQRMNMMLSLLDKKDSEEMEKIRSRAKKIIDNPSDF
ncbi:cryptochrome/photolyase family protein [Christiangramia sabulilitoris]|uniref:Cryptochrome/photolyase family protein n=1 Tax=Christiangramia sabulilitoris TaxID=2583991 RepID=A0A550I3M3_9FLAO|nr:cryptochrome/photolyase family protein [Christiangramia sabulilitoris]TRO65584.1 cryptochrome/photolyase family protein [Christiangramia sabulilitoris]